MSMIIETVTKDINQKETALVWVIWAIDTGENWATVQVNGLQLLLRQDKQFCKWSLEG